MFLDAMSNSMAASAMQLWEYMIRLYGYLALVVGAFLEGETVIILGGFSAQRGYLLLTGVMLAGFLGAIAGDWLFFYLGRAQRHFILEKKPDWKNRVDKINAQLMRYRDGLIVGRRFMYGLRNITSFVIGMSPVPIRKFIILNLASVILWAGVYATLGFLFGGILEHFLGDLKRYEGRVIITVLAVAIIFGAIQFYRLQKKTH